MFIAIISALIIFYCVSRIVDTKPLYLYVTTEDYITWYDTIFIILIMLWTFINVFMFSGPVSLLALIALVFMNNQRTITMSNLRIMLSIILAASIVIGMNSIYFKFSMWEWIFNLLL